MDHIKNHLQKDTLHHAYLFSGDRVEILPHISLFLKELNITAIHNPDYVEILTDSFKIDEAHSLRAMSNQKSFSGGKKVFVLAANSFSLDAQQALLKMFEEPIAETHFFVIVPDINSLIRTLISRFYIVPVTMSEQKNTEAKKFIQSDNRSRIELLKELLVDEDEDLPAQAGEILDSPRSKAIKFLNSLGTVLHSDFIINKDKENTTYFDHIFKVRQFLRQPGSSAKTLMESVALIIPHF